MAQLQSTSITGSLIVTGGITGSLSGGTSAFPFTGSADITGSLNVIGDTTLSGLARITGSTAVYSLVITNTRASNPTFISLVAPGNNSNDGLFIDQATSFSNRPFIIQTTAFSGWGDLTLQRFGGSVGIGVVTPTARLQVRGSGATFSSTALRIENSNFSASLVVLDDGAVGIGTSSPTATLHVSGGAGSTATFEGGSSQTTLLLKQGSNLNYIVGLTNNISFRPNGTEALYLRGSNSSVGIGTQTPTALLHISGASSTALFEVDSPALNNIIFVSGSGNVGIGTGAPIYPLDISGSNFRSLRTSTPFQVESGNDNYRIANLIGNNGYHAGAGTNNTFDIFSVGANPTSSGAGNNTPFFRVNLAGGNSTGYYGAAGSNNSLVQLNSLTTSTIIASAQNSGIAMIGGTGGGQAVLTTISAGSNLDLRSDNNGSFAGGGIRYYSSINGSNHSHRWYHNTAEQMRLSFGGNLLLGTTSELARLQVRGSGATLDTTALRVENSNFSASLVVRNDLRVGINNESPAYTLDVDGNAQLGNNNYYARLTSGGSDGGIFRVGGPSYGQAELKSYALSLNGGHGISGTGGTSQFSIVSNVAPAAAQSVNAGAAMKFIAENSGSGGGVWPAYSTALAFNFLKKESDGTYTSTFSINGGTNNIGIGTIIPTARLHISGASNVGLFEIDSPSTNNILFVSGSGNVGIGTGIPSARLNVVASGTNTSILVVEDSARKIKIGRDQIQVTNESDVVSTMFLQPNGGNLVINSTSGNIGIGKTTPNAKLDVSGSTIITGSLNVTGGITGSLLGTSSFATQALSASFVNTLNQNVLITGSAAIGTGSLGPNENTLTLGARDTTNEGGQIGFNAPGGTYTSASFIDNWQNKARILKGNNTTSTGLIAQWDIHTTQMQLPGYTAASSFPGTATANLAVDSGGNVITVSTSGGTVFPYTGNAVITGSLTATAGFIAPNTNGAMYLRGGDDVELWDINISNHLGVYGQQDATIASIKLGSGGGIISGRNNNIGIGTTTPNSTLDVNGNTIITGSLSQGLGTDTSGVGSHAEGNITTAIGNYSHAEGNGTTTSGFYAHAEGVDNTAWGEGSHAEGNSTYAYGDGSHAEGNVTISSGSFSHAEGISTTASGSYSHAEGQSTLTIGQSSHAEGTNTITEGNHSHAEGYGAIAFGQSSHAEGYGTLAIGSYSHAEGYTTQAVGLSSHAEGIQTLASGSYSHAEGFNTIAFGDYSHAEGDGTIASGSAQTVMGRFNTRGNSTSLVIIGNGSNDSNRRDLVLFNQNNVVISSSLNVTSGITGSLFGTASFALSASWAPSTGGGGAAFPFTGSAVITGSLTVTGSISNNVLSGSDSRVLVATSTGTLEATNQIIIQTYIDPNGTQASLLNSTGNWNVSGSYVGTTITGTYQGQKHYNTTYFFEAVDDNLWIRLLRV